ncbi:MAG: hypothetical protein INF81_11980 [Roseomonas sp.]|nr:hypothetical protein [Roseomonas sp.]MCA3431051.1 hypothetical protein [Roseomonas sp.]MCA3434322.1 hypothetical protein [Roseomonas sp.]
MTQAETPHPLIASLEGEIKQIISLWQHFDVALNQIRDPNGVGLDRNAALQWGGTLDDFCSQFLSLLLILETISQAKVTTLIPVDSNEIIREKLRNLRVYLEGVLQTLNQSIEGGVNQVMPNSVSFIQNNGSNIDLDPHFRGMFQLISSLSVLLFPIVEAVKLEFNLGHSIDELRKSFTELAKILADSRRIALDTKAVYVDAENSAKAAADLKGQIEADKLETQRNKTESGDDRNTTAGYKSEASTRLAEIRQVAENAANLSSQVTAYDAQFAVFKDQLEERDKRYAIQSGKLDDLIKKNELSAAEVERLTKDANAMLTGATVAGLASAYAKIKDDLSEQLIRAQRHFVYGIGFLTLSLFPLAAYTIPFLGNWLGQAPPPPDLRVDSYALQILARLALLLPAAWYLRFAANRHAALFRLREEYAHRYSLASSVEGFKKQAEEFKDHIAATTYENISINPASALDKSKNSNDGDPPAPLMRSLLDTFEKTVGPKGGKN